MPGPATWLTEMNWSFRPPEASTLKNELVYRTAYVSRKAAMDDIARWIELRYNRTRLHSTRGYRTPQEAMDEYLNGREAA